MSYKPQDRPSASLSISGKDGSLTLTIVGHLDSYTVGGIWREAMSVLKRVHQMRSS
jgi:hypothetical protein